MLHINKGSITVGSRTIKLLPGESVQLQVTFNSMEPCALRYVLDSVSCGQVTSEGLYTAPDKPGTYEIRISCADNYDINTYAYISVE